MKTFKKALALLMALAVICTTPLSASAARSGRPYRRSTASRVAAQIMLFG